MLDHLHVRLGPIPFAKLPDVDDIAIEDKAFGFYGFKVAQQLFGMTTIGAQVHVGNHYQFYFAFSFLAQREKVSLYKDRKSKVTVS